MKPHLCLLLPLLCAIRLSAAPAATEPTNAEEAAKQKAAAEAGVAVKYREWVATLSPGRQAWEKVLQENLGNFYLPIHQKEKIEGRANAWDFVEDDPALPRVLLIGDSVSRGYTQAARKALEGKANLHRAPANCGPTKQGIEKLEVWLGQGRWDLIHFNFGIHDRATPLEEYRERLGQIMDRLAATGATLVWATTTPIPDTKDGKYAALSIVERNGAALELAKEKGIAVNDLFAAMTPRLAEYQPAEDVHFKAPGYDFLGATVAAAIMAALEKAP